jgi:flagellar hook-associated protein 2
LDVDQLVKDLMKARRASYDKLWQKKTQLEWKKTDYNTMYTTIRDFRNTTVFSYKLQNTLISKTASSTAENIVTASANAEAANVTHDINVLQLAAGAKLTSAGSISVPSANKDSLGSQFGLAADTYEIVLKNGTASANIQVDTSKSIYDFVSSINNAGIGIRANYDTTLDRFFVYTTGSGAGVDIDFSATVDTDGLDFINKTLKLADVTSLSTSGQTSSTEIGVTDPDAALSTQLGMTGSFTIKLTNGTSSKDITISDTDSLNSLIAKIKSAGVNADAGYSADRFTLKAASGTLSIAGSDQAAIDFLNDKLKLSISQTTPNPSGKDAQFTLDGVNLAQASNNFTVSGVTYNLKALGEASILVSPDNNQAVANVKSFMDSYNALLEKINGELAEDKYSDYLPLTSDQKKEMKDTEITDWEKKAKSGLLRHDAILEDVVYKLRSDISAPVSGLTGKYNSLAAIGVTTGNYSEGGKLYLDETKLKKALEEDPDVLSKIFSATGAAANQQGVAVRFYNTLKIELDKITAVGGYSGTISSDTSSSLAKEIRRYNSDLDKINDRLQDMEARYYKQFDAMETALSKLNQQSSWLSQQLSS